MSNIENTVLFSLQYSGGNIDTTGRGFKGVLRRI